MTHRHLRPVQSFDRETGELTEGCPGCQERDDKIEGLQGKLTSAAGQNTKLKRELAHMQGVEPDAKGVREVLEYARDKLRPDAKIIPASPAWKKVKERLAEKDIYGERVFSVATLKQAVDGVLRSQWHLDEGYVKPETIFRDSGTTLAHIGRLLEWQAKVAPILKLPVPLQQAELDMLAVGCECGHVRIEHSKMRWEGAGPMVGWEPCMAEGCECTDFYRAVDDVA